MYAQREPREPSPAFKYVRYLGVGTEFFLTVALFTLVGLYGDRKLGTGVLLTLVGLAIGFTAGVYRLWREVFSAEKPKAGGPSRGDSSGEQRAGRHGPSGETE